MRLLIPFILSIIFLAAGLWTSYQSNQPASPEAVTGKIAERISNELIKIDEEARIIMKNVLDTPHFSLPKVTSYPFLIYSGDSLHSWSSNSIVPPTPLVSDDFSIKLLKTSGGDFLAKKWPVNAKNAFLLALIPLHRQYTIRNSYLQPEWNKNIFPEGKIAIYEPNANRGTPVCINDLCLFRIGFIPDDFAFHENTRGLSIIFIAVSIAFLIYFIINVIINLKQKHPDIAFLILLASLWLIRVTMTASNYPGRFVHSSLFDPQVFASSNLNRSLGDLFLNMIILSVVCYFLFKQYYRFKSLRIIYDKPVLKGLFPLLYSLVFFFSMLFPFVVVQTIYNNSSIVLDISQSLQFDTLRVIALVILILSWVCSFLFSHIFLRLLISLSPRKYVLLYIFAGGLFFVLVNMLTRQPYLSALVVGIIYFGIVYWLNFYRKLLKVSYITFTYLFTAIIVFAVASTVAIRHFNVEEKIESQFRFADNFLIDRDVFAEHLLHELAHKISADGFIQSRVSSPFLSKDAIRQKVRKVFIPSYFNKYDVEVLLFGAGGNPLNNRSTGTFSELINQYDKEAFQTEYDRVYFINDPMSEVTHRYLVVSPIVKTGITAGYVVLELLLKRVIPESVYPELLIDNRFQQFYKVHDFSYAVYGKEILYSSGVFNYETKFKREYLGDPRIHLNGIVRDNHIHVAVEDGNNRVAVVTAPLTPPEFILANFSFLLVLGLTLLLIFILIQGLITLLQGNTLFYSARIQLVLNLAFFLPLIIVSATTLRLASLTSQEQLNEEYLNKSKSFGAQMESILEESNGSDEEDPVDFENQLTDMAKIFNIDANIYSPKGYLLATTQQQIFESGLIAPYIDPDALSRIRNGEINLIETEKIGQLNYSISVAALKSPFTGKVIGILSLPFFQSFNSLEKIQINVLANILNIFAIVFITLIILSYMVSEWLTFPLRFITHSLSRTTLTKNNEPLKWGANDEIGMMVKEYNMMLYKLGESKAELEQTQRERAWREMAQQVAHEIKNPLTPMKLTLQQLQRSLSTDESTNEKIIKALPALLSQVDTLNDIASSFSTFAKMPEPDIKRVEINSLVKRAVDLHSQAGAINLKLYAKELYVKGDDQLLGRIFSNIILNAFQAARPGAVPHLDISTEILTDYCRVTFQDNGKGIDEKLAERVFVPHFSTKQSGSGLGLAIARQGIEHMKGKIWFESEPGKGTTFFIELPLA